MGPTFILARSLKSPVGKDDALAYINLAAFHPKAELFEFLRQLRLALRTLLRRRLFNHQRARGLFRREVCHRDHGRYENGPAHKPRLYADLWRVLGGREAVTSADGHGYCTDSSTLLPRLRQAVITSRREVRDSEALLDARLPVVCLETRQVKAALSAKRYQSGEVDRVMGPIKGSAHKKILTPAGPAL